jgi:TorA maturation chaperone TorD
MYALLSRLYSAAPDAALLAAIASAQEVRVERPQSEGSSLAGAWHELVAASAITEPASAAEEYQDLFVGVGKSEVSLHGSTYAKALSGKQLLVGIRETLSRLGLARRSSASTYEDHLAAVCETMRLLITGAGQIEPFGLDEQREFFSAGVEPWVFACCSAISAKTVANYYRRVAQFTESFMAVERDSFAME